jgi:3-methylcrotonyl-CoA carboxylase beta subunit
MHSSVSGVTDHLATSDEHAIVLARRAVAHLNYPSTFAAYRGVEGQLPEDDVEQPLYDASELHGIVSTDLKRPFDMRDLIARIVDGSKMHELYVALLPAGPRRVGRSADGSRSVR